MKYLHQEIKFWQSRLPICPDGFETVYFGGGTPSIYSPDELASTLDLLKRKPSAETTLELDPGTFDVAKLNGYLQAGFNRFSFGL